MAENITAFLKYHLQPLTLIEIAAVVTALVAGWKLIALAILSLHLTRMAITAARARRGS